MKNIEDEENRVPYLSIKINGNSYLVTVIFERQVFNFIGLFIFVSFPWNREEDERSRKIWWPEILLSRYS